MAVISLSKAMVKKQNSVVILPIEEYRRLLAAAVPTYYLKGKAALRLDKLVEKSLRARLLTHCLFTMLLCYISIQGGKRFFKVKLWMWGGLVDGL